MNTVYASKMLSKAHQRGTFWKDTLGTEYSNKNEHKSHFCLTECKKRSLIFMSQLLGFFVPLVLGNI